MKPALTLLAEAVVAADAIRLELLELEHTINQIHASRDFESLEEEATCYLKMATEILRADLPGGIERIRNLFEKVASEGGHSSWIYLYNEMRDQKSGALSGIWVSDAEMMKKAFLAADLYDTVWDQVDIQLEMDPAMFGAYRQEFVRRFDWNSNAVADAQYFALYDYFMATFEPYRSTRLHQSCGQDTN